jgi:predicted RNase H-like nuclease (RuvC/YqgF family)
VKENEERMAEGMKNLEGEVDELQNEVNDLERALEGAKEEEANLVFQLEEVKAAREQEAEEVREEQRREVEGLQSRLKARDQDME